MKRIICLLFVILFLLCVGCSQQTVDTTDIAVTEEITIAPELLPDVFENASAFFDAGNIEIHAPLGATEVTQVILSDEICQVQFVFNEVFYTYRGAFASTGRTGYDLTGIVPEIEYLDADVDYSNASVPFAFEAHLLENGGILLWSDGEINFSLFSYGGTFDDLSAVADLILN